MKNKTTNLLLAASILVAAISCKKDSDTGPEKNTSLASIEAKLYPIRFGEVSSIGTEWERIEYDSEGRITLNMYTSNPDFEDELTYLTTETYKYENNLLVEKNVNGLSSYSKFKYEYGNGRLLKTLEYGTGGSLKNMSVHEYNENNQLVKTTYFTGSTTDSRVSRIVEYEYDGRGNIVKMTYTHPSTGDKNTEFNEYDDKSNIIGHGRVNDDGSKFYYNKHEYVYGSNNRIEQHVFNYSLQTYKHVNRYDSDNNIVERDLFEQEYGGTSFEQTAVIRYTYNYK